MELERFQDLPDLPEEEEEQIKNRPYLEEVRSLRKYVLPNYPLFIGRDKQAGICLPVSAVSRKHAKVFEKEGIFYLQDLGSINGTYLNDKRILDPVELHEGDRIKLSITKDYPKGAKEFTFRAVAVPQQDSERDEMLKEAGVGARAEVDKKILLRHCVFKILKKDIVSMFKSDARRVALTRIHMGHKALDFQSLTPYKLKDTLNFTIEHPKLTETLQFTLKVNKVSEVDKKVQQHETEIIKASEKHTQIYGSMIKESPLICYVTSQLKE